MMKTTRRRRHRLAATASMLALALVLAACGGADDTLPEAEPSPSEPAAPEPEPTDDGGDPDAWDAGAPPEWEEILAAARDEGTVVVAGFPFLAEPMGAAFEADTGIQLDWLGGGGELSARLAQEAESGSVTIDLQLGLGSDPWTLYPQGYTQDLRPQLLLPSVVDGENWRDGEIRWIDPDGAYFIQPAEYVHGWAFINTDYVDPADLQDWDDLLDPQFQGMIASHDPTTPGPGQGAANFLQVVFGIDYVQDLFLGQEVVYTSDNNQLIEWAARGEYPIVLGSIQAAAERFRAEGFPLEPALPGYLTGGFSPIKQVHDVPHPNAATVFLNWYLSERGQRVYSDVVLEQSLRANANYESVPSYVDPEQYPYLDFNGYEWDYYVNERTALVEGLVDVLTQGR